MNELFHIAALMATGYGEVEGGQPTWEQREMIVYTNFVRVDPTHWTSAYDCNISTFSSSEKQPIDPVLYHDGLTAIAQLHTEEMNQYDFRHNPHLRRWAHHYRINRHGVTHVPLEARTLFAFDPFSRVRDLLLRPAARRQAAG